MFADQVLVQLFFAGVTLTCPLHGEFGFPAGALGVTSYWRGQCWERLGFLSLSEEFSCTPAPAGQAGGIPQPLLVLLQGLAAPLASVFTLSQALCDIKRKAVALNPSSPQGYGMK